MALSVGGALCDASITVWISPSRLGGCYRYFRCFLHDRRGDSSDSRQAAEHSDAWPGSPGAEHSDRTEIRFSDRDAKPFFGAAGGTGRGPRGRVQPGEDALIRIDLTLEECASGVARELTVDTAVL